MIAKLVIASGKRAGRAISMKRDKLLIGRAEECDLRPLSEEVSRKHCAIIQKDDVLWAKQEISVPDDVQASLDGTAPDRR